MSERETLRRAIGDFAPRPDGYDRVLERRDRRQRNQRIRAGALGVAITLLGALVFTLSVRSKPSPMDGDHGPTNTAVFQRTTTIGGLTVSSPSDWYLVDYWGDWNPDPTSLKENAIPIFELTNFDPGLSKPVCDVEPGEPTRLPADGVAILVTVGDDGRAATDLCGGSTQASSTGTVDLTAYHNAMAIGPAVTARDRVIAEEIWHSMSWTGLTFYTRDRSPRYVLDGWQSGSKTTLLEALPLVRNVELSRIVIDGNGVREDTLENFHIPWNAVGGEMFGAVKKAAARVELRRFDGGPPLVARLISLPPSLTPDFNVYVFERDEPAEGEVVAIGNDGEILGTNLRPVRSKLVGTLRAFGTTWEVKASWAQNGAWTVACVQPAATVFTRKPCERAPLGGPYVQTFGEPSSSVFVFQIVGDNVQSMDVRSDDGTVSHAVLFPIHPRGPDDRKVAVVALERGGRGRFVYHLTDGRTEVGGHIEWPDLGQVVGDGSFPPAST